MTSRMFIVFFIVINIIAQINQQQMWFSVVRLRKFITVFLSLWKTLNHKFSTGDCWIISHCKNTLLERKWHAISWNWQLRWRWHTCMIHNIFWVKDIWIRTKLRQNNRQTYFSMRTGKMEMLLNEASLKTWDKAKLSKARDVYFDLISSLFLHY